MDFWLAKGSEALDSGRKAALVTRSGILVDDALVGNGINNAL
jgi:hypothetical protein